MGFVVSVRPGTIVIFNERSAKCHFKDKHSIPPNSQGREGSSCAAGRWCFFPAAVIEQTRANHRSHLSQEPIQDWICASLLLTWHEIVKLSKSSTETSLYWHGQNETESWGNYVDKWGQKYLTIERKTFLYLKLFTATVRVHQFIRIMNFILYFILSPQVYL